MHHPAYHLSTKDSLVDVVRDLLFFALVVALAWLCWVGWDDARVGDRCESRTTHEADRDVTVTECLREPAR